MNNRHRRPMPLSHHRGHSGRDNLFYLYEPECECSDTGALTPKPSAIVRSNPIPPGRYWVDVFGKNIPNAEQWFKAMSGLGVHVDSTEHFPATELPEVRDWYLFTYTPKGNIPVVWDQKTFGFLSLATPDIKSSADTVQRPPPEKDPLDSLSSWLGDLPSAGSGLALAALLVGGYLAFEALNLGKVVSHVRKRIRK